MDGKPETDADRRFFDLRAAGYYGPIDQDGHPVTLPWPHTTTPNSDPATMTEAEFQRWCDKQDDRYANTCAERERDAYLDYHERRDVEQTSGPLTPASTLRAAGRYLSQRGWIQGAYYDATSGSFTPPACMVGAIGSVCYGGPVDAPATHYRAPGYPDFEAALAQLDAYLTIRYGELAYEYNDAKGRIAPEVIAVLNAAADDYDGDAPTGTPVRRCPDCGAPNPFDSPCQADIRSGAGTLDGAE
jgi:hypothetical protein